LTDLANEKERLMETIEKLLKDKSDLAGRLTSSENNQTDFQNALDKEKKAISGHF